MQPTRWNAKQRFELVRGQLDAQPETRARGVAEEIAPEHDVRQ